MTNSNTCSNQNTMVSSSLMRAVVGLSALAVSSAITSNAAPRTAFSSSALNQTEASVSCAPGASCYRSTASVLDIKAARAMAAAEVDMDGEFVSSRPGRVSSIFNSIAIAPLKQAITHFQQRGNTFRDIDEDGVDVSPQAKAQKWLAETFDMDFVQHKSMSHSAAIAERYALAVFFYSLDGEEWETSLDFLSNTDVCQWNGMVSADYHEGEDVIKVIEGDEEVDNDMVDQDTSDDDDENDEDEFFVNAGVFCDDSGSVVSLSIPNYIGMEGSIPAELDLLTNLQVLDLQQQPIEGIIPTELASLTNLRHLSIQDTSISGIIPSELALLTNLEKLELTQNQLWGRMPEELGDMLAKVTSLRFSRNMLTGSIPESYGLMGELEFFDLSSNRLSGAIPPTVFNFLANIRAINFSDNELTGEVPAEIRHVSNRDVTNLVINLSHNKLTGKIPKELGEMTGTLEQIFLNDNQLSGEIPAEIGNLRDSLMTFHVQNNELTGTVPSKFANMMELLYFDISGNDLVGSLDDVLCNNRDQTEFEVSMYSFSADCGGSQPKIACRCCTLCCKSDGSCTEA